MTSASWSIIPSSAMCAGTICRGKEWREEHDEAIAALKVEIAELKGKVDALLTLLRGAKAEVIGLPRKRPSDAA